MTLCHLIRRQAGRSAPTHNRHAQGPGIRLSILDRLTKGRAICAMARCRASEEVINHLSQILIATAVEVHKLDHFVDLFFRLQGQSIDFGYLLGANKTMEVVIGIRRRFPPEPVPKHCLPKCTRSKILILSQAALIVVHRNQRFGSEFIAIPVMKLCHTPLVLLQKVSSD